MFSKLGPYISVCIARVEEKSSSTVTMVQRPRQPKGNALGNPEATRGPPRTVKPREHTMLGLLPSSTKWRRRSAIVLNARGQPKGNALGNALGNDGGVVSGNSGISGRLFSRGRVRRRGEQGHHPGHERGAGPATPSSVARQRASHEAVDEADEADEVEATRVEADRVETDRDEAD